MTLNEFVIWICPKCQARLSSSHKDTLKALKEHHKKKCKDYK